MKRDIKRIVAVAFSPTGGTKGRLRLLAEAVRQVVGVPCEYRSYTLPAERTGLPVFGPDDLLLWASPVYAGRLPNKLTDYVAQNLRGEGTPFVALVTFGNRSEGEALSELVGLARRGGCVPLGAAAVVMPHVFSARIAADRPTAADDAELRHFGAQVAARALDDAGPLAPFADEAPTAFYTPLRVDGTPARFLKAVPEVDPERCTLCGRCAEVCPMGSLAVDGAVRCPGVCIKCQACIMACPQGAMAITHPDFVSHTAMLEQHYAAPSGNRFFL